MNIGSSVSALVVAISLAAVPLAHGANPLPRSTPEAQGISSQAVLDFVGAVDKINTLHSFMIVRHGQVIAEAWWKPESADKPHVLWSLSKSFNSTAVGLAIEDGKLSLDDPVLKFFPNDAPADPSENLKAMKVRDLLTMTGGHDTEPRSIGGNPTVKQFLAHPVPHAPGTHFLYNTMGSYVLSAIVTKVTGQTTLDYLKPRLFEPLGIENPQWTSSPEGNSHGGYGLKLRTEDIAKFGQLYLQKGKWNGHQLVPEKWVEQATSKQVPNDQEGHSKIGIDWTQGYGFQFWRCTHNAFRGDGANGQLCVIIPDKDTVIAITADTGNFQGEMNAIWEKLYPAFQDAALPADAAGQEKVKQATASLEAHPVKKVAKSIIAPGAELKKIVTDCKFTEGPASDSEGNVYFTDQPNDRILKYSIDGKLSTFMQPCGRCNGLCFDASGNLWACADENNELWKIDSAGKHTVIVKDFHGKLLNGPNDVWLRPEGGLYFTDPFYKRDYWKRSATEQDKEAVYYLAPDLKTLTRVVDDMKQPNGIIGTPDGKKLYISDIGGHQTYVYDVQPDGSLSNKKLFCELGSDGMTIDDEGNVYLTGKGVTVFDKAGKQIEKIDIKEPWTGNVCFGGRDRKTLFITASNCVYTLSMRVTGAGSQ
jgi:sugar lactone lactonase YvrE/CubicO group peptidase (beta-lactamase class C family)